MNTLFKNRISTEAELRSMLGYPSRTSANKTISTLDSHCRALIAKSPLLILSTADAAGNCDNSPRGDTPGFVSILDDRHLAIPERKGNRRLDTLRNIVSNPHIGLLFMIPGFEATLRVNGRASIIADEEILAQMEADGIKPLLAIGVEVDECFLHLSRSFTRSQLWEPDTWPERESLPPIEQILADHLSLSEKEE